MQPVKAAAQLQRPAEKDAGKQCDAHGRKHPFRIEYIILMRLKPAAEYQIGTHRNNRVKQECVPFGQKPIGKADGNAQDKSQRSQADFI